MQRLKILGTGSFLPPIKVFSEELDRIKSLPLGTVEAKTGVRFRHRASPEFNQVYMAKEAGLQALQRSELRPAQIDLVISAGAIPYQFVPSNAVHYHQALGLSPHKAPAFDIHATCLSFIYALEYAHQAIALGRKKHILIISSEISSLGLLDTDIEAMGLFGDGAAAILVGPADSEDPSALLDLELTLESDHTDLCYIEGGGTRRSAEQWNHSEPYQYSFQMEGPRLFKLAMKSLPGEIEKVLNRNALSLDDIKMIIPHQASYSALELMRRRLKLTEDRFYNIITDHGNCISASLPMALNHAIERETIVRGDHIMLLGTGAGFSTAVCILKY